MWKHNGSVFEIHVIEQVLRNICFHFIILAIKTSELYKRDIEVEDLEDRNFSRVPRET